VAYSGPTEDDVRRLKDIIRLEKQSIALTTEQAAVASNLKSIYGSLAQALQAMLQARIDGNATLNEDLDVLNKQLAVLQRMSSTAQTLKEISALKISIAEQEYAILEKTTGVTADVLAKEKERIIALKAAEESLEKQKQSVEEISKSFAELVTQGVDLRQSLNVENITKQFNDLVAVISKPSSWLGALWKTAKGIFTGMIDQIIQMTLNVIDMERGFQRATGAGDEFARSLTDVYEANVHAGVSMEEVDAAFQSLYTGYTDFTTLNAATQKGLAGTAVRLNELGVSVQDFTKIQQYATKGMGVSADDIGQTQRDITKLAMEIGVAPGKMAADMAAVAPELTKFGDAATDVFQELARTSKDTGIEIGRLLQITSKFDTFEGAAEQAGQLNAALGGNFVNAMDLMMETDPNERFRMIRDSVLDAGLSFDEMSYYQKNFYKDAMGLADVGELAMALSDDMDTVNESAEMTSAEWEELKNKQQSWQDIQDQVKNALLSLVPIIKPLIDWVSKLATEFSKPERLKKIEEFIELLVDGMGDIVSGVQAAMGPVGTMWKWFQGAMSEFVEKHGGTAKGGVAGTFQAIGLAIAKLEPVIQVTMIAMKIMVGSLIFMADKLMMLVKWLTILKDVFMFLTWPIRQVWGLFSDLADLLFKKTFASTFLEGVGKVAAAFLLLKGPLSLLVEPFRLIRDVINSVGEAVGTVLASVGNIGKVLGDSMNEGLGTIQATIESIIEAAGTLGTTLPEAIGSAMVESMDGLLASMEARLPTIVDTINDLDTGKALAIGATMVAGATAGAVASVAGGESEPAAAAAGGTETVRQPIHLVIDGEPLKKYILEVVGTDIRDVNFSG